MIISVINLKGGSGKTTTAMALATAAARHNRNVSVLDTDPQGDATTWAGDAEDAGETLPFTVDSANIGKLKRLRKTMADDELVIIDCPRPATWWMWPAMWPISSSFRPPRGHSN